MRTNITPEVADHFFLVLNGDDESCGSVCGSMKEAEKHCGYHKEATIKKVDFVAADTERRFVTVRSSWCPVEPPRRDDGLYSPLMHWLTENESEFTAPSSLVAVSPHLLDRLGGEWWWNGFFQTRDEAFADAAKNNAKMDYCDWHIIAEFGAPIPLYYCDVELDENTGVGKVDHTMQYPIRLVIPTADELARYPVPQGAMEAAGAI